MPSRPSERRLLGPDSVVQDQRLEERMRAAVGDRLHFEGKVVGMHEHTAVVVEARGKDGAPPYLVRHDDGHETVVYPGPDVWIEHREETSN